jgi:hypothetical protein
MKKSHFVPSVRSLAEHGVIVKHGFVGKDAAFSG